MSDNQRTTDAFANQPELARRRGLATPIAVNAVLLGLLAMITLEPWATAQSGQARGRGEYLLFGAEPGAGSDNDVFIVDTQNQELVVVRWDAPRKELEGIGYRNLDADVRGRPTGR